jgi:predicted DNA-binding antitoxin AbrB/MazE fold protein
MCWAAGSWNGLRGDTIWEVKMYAIKAIYDGSNFKPTEPIPVKEKYEVVITFTNPVRNPQEKLLDYFNTWDKEDFDCVMDSLKDRDLNLINGFNGPRADYRNSDTAQ